MRFLRIAFLLSLMAVSSRPLVAQRGAQLRAVFLETNPAHAVKDPVTGVSSGVAIDVARELGRRLSRTVTLAGLPNPQSVIDAVQRGEADIGFVAYNPERAGPVEFSQTYMLVQQTFIVREDSTIRSVSQIDRPNQKIGAGKGDSIALYLARNLKQAQLVEVSGLDEGLRLLSGGKLDAFGANRQRLTDGIRGATGQRLLPDDLYGVEQNIIVSKGDAELLRMVNQFIDDIRKSGYLQASIERSRVIGIRVAPAAP